MTLKSNFEQTAKSNAVVGTETSEFKLPYALTDKKGDIFKAKVDGLLSDSIYIEYKAHQLNSKTSLQSSTNEILNQLRYRFPAYRALPDEAMPSHDVASGKLWNAGFHTDCLKHAWNHSAYKQAIVAKRLAENGIRLIVIFDKHPPMLEYRGKKLPFQAYYTLRHGLETYSYRHWIETIRPQLLEEARP